MYNFIDWLGLVAAICTTSAFIPQVVKVWRSGKADGISNGMYVILIVGLVLWLWYGVVLSAWPIILANAITLILAATILIMKWSFERRIERGN